MLLNFLKSAYRNLVRNWVQSLIQILSLAIGLMIFTMIALYLYDELTVDRSNENLEQVYRIENRLMERGNMGTVRAQMGPFIQENIPEILQMTRIEGYRPATHLSINDESGEPMMQVAIQDYIRVDSGFLDIFPQEFIQGDPRSALKDPYSIVLTKSLADIFYGKENPMGRTFSIGTYGILTVTGVIKDPLNTHLKFEALGVFSYEKWTVRPEFEWQQYRPTYIKIHKNADIKEVETKIEDAWFNYLTVLVPDYDRKLDLSLCSLREVHFSDIEPWALYMSVVDKKVLLNFFLLGLVILLLGIINYINLSTARATRRSREMAIKKVVGSSRFKLIKYFLIESVLATFFSFLVAATCLQLLFQRFNQVLQADINLYFLALPASWLIILAGILIVGVLAGIYPAILMSTHSPVPAQAGVVVSGGRGLITRRILMLIQFTLAVVLMIGILVMHLQIIHMKNYDLGFDSDRIVFTQLGNMTEEQRLLLLSRLDRFPEIERAGFSNQIPGRDDADLAPVDNPNSVWHGLSMGFFQADLDFFEVYGLKFTHGGDLLDQKSLRRMASDTTLRTETRSWVINETCRKALKLEDPVGFQTGDNSSVWGVVEDFHFRSLLHPINPLQINLLYPGEGRIISMKISSSDIPGILGKVEKEIHNIRYGDNTQKRIPTPVRFTFIEDSFSKHYYQAQRIHDASALLSILALFIACLGLFGLSTFMAQRRTKEIGVRKAMGSSEWQVFVLLAKEFIKWVAISVVIGCPVGWYVMKQWQQQFAFKAPVGIWVYVIVALIAFAIAFLTVAWQSLKTARANPVDALRNE